jgi:hypothetical protein
MIEVLSPVAGRKLREVSLAPRPADLNGKVLGLLDNGKPNAGRLVAEVAERLAMEFRLRAVVSWSKSEGPLGAGGPLSEEERARLVSDCDLVINAIGD